MIVMLEMMCGEDNSDDEDQWWYKPQSVQQQKPERGPTPSLFEVKSRGEKAPWKSESEKKALQKWNWKQIELGAL